MTVDFVDNIAKIMSADDSIPNADAMQTLIRLISETSSPLGATEQELLRTSLMATGKRPLLESFSHSPALVKVAEWLAQSQQHDVTLSWLALLGHMPMTIKSLTDSGVGKVVNKLRKSAEKSEDAAVIAETKGLLERWKALTSAEVGGGAAKADAAPAKRARAEAAEGEAKRPKQPAASLEDDSSLDSALSAAVPRKASLKPDHMKPRRPVQPLVPSAAARPPPTPAGCACGGAPTSHPTIIVPPDGASGFGGGGAKQRSPVEAAATAAAALSPPPTYSKRRRVAWLTDDKGGVLCETKEYVVEQKDKAPQAQTAELEGRSDLQERWARELQGEKAAMQRRRDGSLDLGVHQLPWGMVATEPSARPDAQADRRGAGAGGAPPAGPQETLQWRTPPLLDQSLWPEVKGDLSTERDAQRQRRAMVPEARYHSVQDMPATPHEPPEHEQLPQRDVRLTPTIPLEPVPQPEPGPPEPQMQMQMQMQQMQEISSLDNHLGGEMLPQHGGMQMGAAMGGMMPGGMMNGNGGMQGFGNPAMCNGGGGMGGGGMPGMGGGMQGAGASVTNVGGLNAKLALQMMMGRSPMQVGMQNRGMQGPGAGFNNFAGMPGMPQGVQQQGNSWQQQGQQQGQDGPAMGVTHHKYRTKPCRYFNLPSGCKNGEGCNFLHQIVGPDYVFDAPGQHQNNGGGRGYGGGRGSGSFNGYHSQGRGGF